jgi:ABC-type cobalamin/Fe3+-siderophores transport system ATPase subunit
MLELSGLAIARGDRVLLRGIDARFEPGTLTALMGANGAGKSSLLATICGTLPAHAGSIRLNGDDVTALDPRTRAQRLALVEPTESALASMSVDDAVAVARFPYHRWWEWQPTPADRAAIDGALHATGLEALRARELGTLSAGERQRVWIAVALAQRAHVIALDEPTTHLDLRFAIETLQLLRGLAAGGAAVIAVLHTLEEAASFADRVIVLGEGRVLADAPPAAAFTPATLLAAYGIAIDVERRGETLTFHRTGKDR